MNNFAAAEGLALSGKKSADNQLLDLSIEELMNIQVTSASRRSQKLSEVPSAIFVITQDDIRRSGATSIPEALRMAPGVEVARIGTDKWAISIRGFNGRFANKLQVMMDGRSVYNPLFAGVQWEQQDTMMEDIERIEVIRGPNAAVWGANAVNGVINIITKKAADTQGVLLSAGGGSFEHGFAGARYGGKINEETPFRIYAKGFTRDHTHSLTGENINDQWHSARGGFRIDHHRGIDQFTLQGDIFYNSYGDRLDKSALSAPIIRIESARGHDEGGNLRLRWDRTYSEKSAIMLQTYYDRVDYRALTGSIYRAESFDIDFQHRFPLHEKHDLTWGANYRLYRNKEFDTELVLFSPRAQINHMASVFIRDEITLLPERLRLNLGSRFDHNDFTGMEIQPNARLMWTPDDQNSIWMAVSRAVRIPSRAENDIQLNTRTLNAIPGSPALLPFPVLAQLMGSSNFKSEKLIAYEMGYRHQFSPQASIDISGFYNDYSQLRDLSIGSPLFHTSFPPHLILPIGLTNKASGQTYGVETSIEWRPNEKWRLQGNYSYLNMNIHSDSALKQIDPTTGSADKVSPHHQVSLRSNYDFSEKLQLNLWLRYVSRVDFYRIPGYVTMDAKIAHKPLKNVELFIVGQNLASQNHREFAADFLPSLPTTLPRGVYAGVELRF
ncbi:TonB-dependent siderophore receptor [Nitrosomonas sp. sh817]|uniref:TonB-dependent receptor plug domain-containing protein n=1 Tax=Nitrosomonas sp. sh817 TaxID=3070658 RepID=UPI0027DC0220|nr:TonB-dependent receptor [Nitrosomonas sp. sh817]WMJ09526.1 TonB-dependent receptor [Nitrosomonas sp. sh817]